MFVVYRWIIALYFFAWLTPVGINSAKFFIYLTNWAFLLFCLYLLVSATAVTLQFAIHHLYNKKNLSRGDLDQRRNNLQGKDQIIRVLFGADYTHEVVWYQQVQWLLITLGLEAAIAVSILYWTVEYSSGDEIDGESLNVHLVNGVVALSDICFSGVIIRLLHVVYLVIFGAVYVIFSGVYYAADGTNAQNEPYIYSAINYGSELGQALLYVFIIALVLLPLLHIIIYAMYRARQWLVRRIYQTEPEMKTILYVAP